MWARFPASSIEIHPSVPGATPGVNAILTSFGTFAPGGPGSRGRETSTFRLRGTPPHTPAHLPTEFRENRSNFFFRGLFARGPGSDLPQVSGIDPGEAPSPAPLAAGTRGLPFRGWAHVPVTLPRGRTPASTLVFRGEMAPRGLGSLPRRNGTSSMETAHPPWRRHILHGDVMMVRVRLRKKLRQARPGSQLPQGRGPRPRQALLLACDDG